jgi:hypothetical protein
MAAAVVDEKIKQKQFNDAMALYTSRTVYKRFGYLVALLNVTLQIVLVFQIVPLSIGIFSQLLAVICSCFITDFVNGLVHMYMDNNDSYHTVAGPLIANFHLHHKIPKYKVSPLPVVYFMETGSKVWLVGYLALVMVMLNVFQINPIAAYILVYVGILSSLAEVSHYLCHTSNSPITSSLMHCGLLLSKRHHGRHHLEDNVNYAFLNGWSDVILNPIAKYLYAGYKNTTDVHYVRYDGENTESR